MHKLYLAYYSRTPSLTGTEKLSLLIRIERDLRKYFACYICNRFYLYNGSENFVLSGPAKNKTSTLPYNYKEYNPEYILSGQSPMTLRTHKDFAHSQSRLSYLQLKLAMKRFHYGAKYGINPYHTHKSAATFFQPEPPNSRISLQRRQHYNIPNMDYFLHYFQKKHKYVPNLSVFIFECRIFGYLNHGKI